jgi:hypothetical protein
MNGMAGRRLRLASVFAAAVAAAAALCIAPTPRSAPLAPVVRIAQAAVTQMQDRRVPVTATQPSWWPQSQSPAGVAPAGALLLVLVLLGVAPLVRRRTPARVSAPARRDRAPPGRPRH